MPYYFRASISNELYDFAKEKHTDSALSDKPFEEFWAAYGEVNGPLWQDFMKYINDNAALIISKV